jgi:hypothetical protein
MAKEIVVGEKRCKEVAKVATDKMRELAPEGAKVADSTAANIKTSVINFLATPLTGVDAKGRTVGQIIQFGDIAKTLKQLENKPSVTLDDGDYAVLKAQFEAFNGWTVNEAVAIILIYAKEVLDNAGNPNEKGK